MHCPHIEITGLPQRRISNHRVPSKWVSLPPLPRCPNDQHNAFFEEIWGGYVNRSDGEDKGEEGRGGTVRSRLRECDVKVARPSSH